MNEHSLLMTGSWMKSVVKPKQSDEEKQLIESAFIKMKLSLYSYVWKNEYGGGLSEKLDWILPTGELTNALQVENPSLQPQGIAQMFHKTRFGLVPRSWWGHKTHYSENKPGMGQPLIL